MDDPWHIGTSYSPEDLDIIGFDIYFRNWMVPLEQLVRFALDKGKETWVNETWASLSIPNFLDPWRARIDSHWLRAVTYYAQNI